MKRSETCWRRGFKHLRTYVEREGHAKVPCRHVVADGYRLGSWVRTQRKANRKGTLLPERRKALEELPGWAWEDWRFAPPPISTNTFWKYDEEFLNEIGDAEEWRPVPGFGHESYQVSNRGRIRRNGNPKCRQPSSKGAVGLSVRGKIKHCSVARIVWQAFSAVELGKTDIIYFKDGNQGNRRFDNLFVTYKALFRQCHGQLSRGVDHSICKLTETAVRHIRTTADKLGYTKNVYRQLGEQYGVDFTTVRDAANGRTWKWLK